jgi:hypothetical protein
VNGAVINDRGAKRRLDAQRIRRPHGRFPIDAVEKGILDFLHDGVVARVHQQPAKRHIAVQRRVAGFESREIGSKIAAERSVGALAIVLNQQEQIAARQRRLRSPVGEQARVAGQKRDVPVVATDRPSLEYIYNRLCRRFLQRRQLHAGPHRAVQGQKYDGSSEKPNQSLI